MTRTEIMREYKARIRRQRELESEYRHLKAIGADAEPTSVAWKNNHARIEWLAAKLYFKS